MSARPRLAYWERTLLELLATDARRALDEAFGTKSTHLTGETDRFVIVVSSKCQAVLLKASEINAGQPTGNPITVRGIDTVIDADATHEYAVIDLNDVARKIECPITR